MGNCGGRWRDGARPMCWRWGLPKGGAALPRAHPSHCPGDPSTLGPPLVGHETPSSANRWLVPLEASAPEDSPSMPSPSPLETTRGTVIYRGCLRSLRKPPTPASSALTGPFPYTPMPLRSREGTRSPWTATGFALTTQWSAPLPTAGVACETHWVERAALALQVPTPA